MTDIQLFTLRNNPLVPYWKPHWTCEEGDAWEKCFVCPLILVIHEHSWNKDIHVQPQVQKKLRHCVKQLKQNTIICKFFLTWMWYKEKICNVQTDSFLYVYTQSEFEACNMFQKSWDRSKRKLRNIQKTLNTEQVNCNANASEDSYCIMQSENHKSTTSTDTADFSGAQAESSCQIFFKKSLTLWPPACRGIIQISCPQRQFW